MSVLKTSWRCALAAAALWALLATGPAPVAADEGQAKPGATAANPERMKLYEQLKALRTKAEQLEKDGKHDDAERVRAEAKALMAKLSPRSAEANPSHAAPSPEQQKLYEQVRAMHTKIGQLEKDGKHEDAERLKKEMRELYTKINPHACPASAIGSRQPAPSSDIGGRLQRLRTAAENLQAAGCEREAQHVREMIGQLQREQSRPEASPQAPRNPRPGAPGEGETARMLQELRGQVEQMHREMRQLHEELNRAKQGESK